jgi:uncharacterized repeat protein (TIGR03803 family)
MRIFRALVFGVALAGCSRLAGAPPPLPVGLQPSAAESRAGAGYKTLYSFRGYQLLDGLDPGAGLIAVNGVLYGTTAYGGSNCANSSGCGTVFSVSTSGKERVLYSFNDGKGGYEPLAALANLKGTLYGTTNSGGIGYGVVFAVSPAGKYRVVYAFKSGKDGAKPEAGLVVLNGKLYGTTATGGGPACGGNAGCGTVFSVTTAGVERVLYRFKGGADGQDPLSGLTVVKGKLYGGTPAQYASVAGTIFELTLSGAKRTVYTFPAGLGTSGGLAASGNGSVLYGTAGGGAYGFGKVFSVRLSGGEHDVYSFKGGTDGSNPYTGAILYGGALYGTTYYGGFQGAPCYSDGCGTVFRVTLSGSERVLVAFKGHPDGQLPTAGLSVLSGKLYGTASAGGTGTECGNNACGTVFTLSP